MNKDLNARDSIIAIVGIVTALAISVWIGGALILLSILLHFFVPDEAKS